ncbi:MAG: hypothetical protein ABSG92_08175 [Conexivisphaerales archaeon]
MTPGDSYSFTFTMPGMYASSSTFLMDIDSMRVVTVGQPAQEFPGAAITLVPSMAVSTFLVVERRLRAQLLPISGYIAIPGNPIMTRGAGRSFGSLMALSAFQTRGPQLFLLRRSSFMTKSVGACGRTAGVDLEA